MRDDLELSAPRLNRFARALICGRSRPCTLADNLVQEVLSSALESPSAHQLAEADLRLHLYSLITELHRDRLSPERISGHARMEKESFSFATQSTAERTPDLTSIRGELASQLLALGLDEREALLLVVLEEFTYAEAARILKISRDNLIARLARARDGLHLDLVLQPAERAERVYPSYLRLVK